MSTPTMTLWIPKNLDPASKTMDIAETMMRDFSVSQINNDTYNNDFNEYYNQHIRQGETYQTFCSKNGTGINVQYLINNANKTTYITLLSLDVNPDDPNDFHVLAMMVFKWSPTAGSAKIQAFCSNQKQQTKGAGTKLLNFLKKTLTHMGINNIYLNPVPSAISYYSSQQFVEARTPHKKVYDTSSPKTKSKSSKSKSKSKSRTKTKTSSQTKTSYKRIPTMTINIRATDNWKKTKTKIRSYQALTRKKYGKTHEANEKNALLAKVDKTVNGLSRDHRDMAQYEDIIELLEKKGHKLNNKEKYIIRKYLEDNYNIY